MRAASLLDEEVENLFNGDTVVTHLFLPPPPSLNENMSVCVF
jgi:hypothetical protein